jgi:putative ABC transport system ATP-binding protein
MIRTRGLAYRYATGGRAVALCRCGPAPGRHAAAARALGLGQIHLAVAGGRAARGHGGDLFVAGTQLGTQRGAEMDAWRARSIGFLPQKLHLSSALTVADNLGLAYFAAGRPRDDAAIARALAQVGVAELAARKPHQLSGGQAQRVALARAVLLRPSCCWPTSPRPAWTTRPLPMRWPCCSSAAACDASLVIATHDQRVVQALAGAACSGWI